MPKCKRKFIKLMKQKLRQIWFICVGCSLKAAVRLPLGHRHQLTSTLMSWVQETQTSGTNAPFNLCGRSQGSLANLCKVAVSSSSYCSLCLVGGPGRSHSLCVLNFKHNVSWHRHLSTNIAFIEIRGCCCFFFPTVQDKWRMLEPPYIKPEL